MIILSLVSLLVGAVLAQYFKISVLVPASAIVLLFAIGSGVTHAQPVWLIVLTTTIASISMQIGYFIGIVVHHFRSASLASRSSSLASHAASARHAAR